MTDKFLQLLRNEIVFLDGAMGTSVQAYKLEEEDFCGDRFKEHGKSLKGNNDLLSITRPDIIKEIHRGYYKAGSHIVETNTFSGTSIAQADYDLSDLAFELNKESAKIALEVAEEMMALDPSIPRFVAGALGPTNKTASISPKVNDPGFRGVSFDELVDAYYEQLNGLVQGGVHIIMIETIFDTLNAKAAVFSFKKYFKDKKIPELPLMISVTITDKSGRTLSGQTVEAFWHSIRHANPISVGINYALGAAEMKPFLARLSKIADCYISCYPNAGLPNPLSESGYDETPEDTAGFLLDFANDGLLNLVGGCCGTTAEHIEAICKTLKGKAARVIPTLKKPMRLSGLEPLEIYDTDSPFIMVGERTNVMGSPKFARLIKEDNFDEALSVAKQQVESGANILDINFDEGLLDSVACMKRFLNLVAAEPDITKVPIMIDSSKWEVLEEGLKCVQGKAIVNSISLKEGEEEFINKAELLKMYGAAVIVMAFDEKGQAATLEDKIKISKRAYDILVDKVSFPAEDIIFDPNILTVGTGIAEHNNMPLTLLKLLGNLKKSAP